MGVDTSMYRYTNPDYFGNFMRGMQAGQQYKQNRLQMEQDRQQAEQQKRDQIEAQKFDQTLRGLVSVNDTTTQEGRMGLLRDLNSLGYGKQALSLMSQFQQMAPKTGMWDNIPGTGLLYERGTGNTKDTGAKPYAKTETPVQPSDPTAWKGERFVRSKNNTMIKVDSQGRDKDGNLVELYTPPARPGAGPKPPKPPAPPKAMSGDASKLLSVSWTVQDDINDLKDAFASDFEGSIAGMKSGTNKRLTDLADQLSDKVGRLRSGGAVNADEEARFMRLIATIRGAAFSNAADADRTLNSLLREAAIVTEAIDPGGANRARISENLPPAARRTLNPAGAVKPHPQDSEAVQWAKSHPNDPRAAAILKANGQ